MGIRPKVRFASVAPKLDGGYKNIGLVDAVGDSDGVGVSTLPNNISSLGGSQSLPKIGKGDSQWQEFSLSFSISDLLGANDIKNYNDFMKKVDAITKIMAALLKIIRLFTSDLFSVNNALKFVIKQIVKTLKDLVNSFMASGVYYTIIAPKQSENDEGFIVPTWGSFDEFRSVIIANCTNTNDIGSPSQLNLDAYVGGFIIGGIAGSNNPKFIKQIYDNADIISDLFGFKLPLPGPPRLLSAQEGIYGNDNKPGIKLTWKRPYQYISSGFLIFRSKSSKGVYPTDAQINTITNVYLRSKDPNQVRGFQKIRLYDNEGFAGPSSKDPVFVKFIFGKDDYTYTDYNVETGVQYNYRVYTVLSDGVDAYAKNPYHFRLDSPLSSNVASATALGCIPISEIAEEILSMEGDLLRKEEYANSRWKQVTLNRFFGSQVDKLLKKVENFADKLIGYVSTPAGAISEYIDFYANKITDYIVIIQSITNIINILVSFRLKGSMLMLDLFEPKKGGIQGFAERINRAQVNSAVLGKKPRGPGQSLDKVLGSKGAITKSVSNDMGQSLSELRGIYYGIVVVYGLGNPGDVKAYAAPYMKEYNDVKKQAEDSAKTFTMLKGIITGNWEIIKS